MKPYVIIPHIADVRLKVEGPTLEALFINALEGMNRILLPDYDKHLNTHVTIKSISLSSFDKTTFLIDFLSEALTLSHIHKSIFYDVRFTKFEMNSLEANLIGSRVPTFSQDIKAVTYHEAEVRKNQRGKYETIIVFDI